MIKNTGLDGNETERCAHKIINQWNQIYKPLLESVEIKLKSSLLSPFGPTCEHGFFGFYFVIWCLWFLFLQPRFLSCFTRFYSLVWFLFCEYGLLWFLFWDLLSLVFIIAVSVSLVFTCENVSFVLFSLVFISEIVQELYNGVKSLRKLYNGAKSSRKLCKNLLENRKL